MLAHALPIDLEKKKYYIVPVGDTAPAGFGSPSKNGGQAATSLRLFFCPLHGSALYGRAVRGSESCAGFRLPGLPTCTVSPSRLEAGLRGLKLAKTEATMPKTMYRALRALFPIQSHPIASTPSMNEARLLGARLVNAGARVVIHRAKDGFIVRGVA
jgi:hypothetical protein